MGQVHGTLLLTIVFLYPSQPFRWIIHQTMFSNDFAKYVDSITDTFTEVVRGGEAVDAQARQAVLHLIDEVVPTLATKSEVIVGAGGGIPEAMADARYAPITGSSVYATKAELPDVSGKANTADVVQALSQKSDTSHTHAGVYQPVGSYLMAADIAGKANITDVGTALATKADASNTYTKTQVDTALTSKSDTSHTHAGVYQPVGSYAPATGSTVYATKDEVTEATGGGLTQTAADGRYVQQTALYQGVTDITDQLYHTKDATYTKTQVDTALSQKSDTTHTHAGVYQPVGSYLVAADIAGKANTSDVTTALVTKADVSTTYTKTQVDTSLALKADTTTLTTELATKAPITNPTNGQNNYAGKDYVDTQLATKQATGSYQTTTNMLKVGSESTYPSKAYADTLYAPIGGASGKPDVLFVSVYWPTTTGYDTIRDWGNRGTTVNDTNLSLQPWGVFHYATGQPTKLVQVIINWTCQPVASTGQRRVGVFYNPTGYTLGGVPPVPLASGSVIHGEHQVEHPGSSSDYTVSLTTVFQISGGQWFAVGQQSTPTAVGALVKMQVLMW